MNDEYLYVLYLKSLNVISYLYFIMWNII